MSKKLGVAFLNVLSIDFTDFLFLFFFFFFFFLMKIKTWLEVITCLKEKKADNFM